MPLTFHYIQFHCDPVRETVPRTGALHIIDTKRLSSNYAYLRQFSEDGSPDAQEWKTHLVADLWRLQRM